jgi:hypothetical protein
MRARKAKMAMFEPVMIELEKIIVRVCEQQMIPISDPQITIFC